MKKILKSSILTAVLVCGFNPLYAGGNHDHGHGHSHSEEKVSENSVKQTALKEIKRLVSAKKIDNSWLKAPLHKIEKKKFHDNMEWVVSYQNKSVKDTTKQTIYIFINLYGEITGANYSGK